MKRILLTGGSGFIGLNLAEHLLACGHHLVIWDRNEPPATAVEEFSSLVGRLDFVCGDIRDGGALMAAAAGADAIIHGTAMTPGDSNEASLAAAAVEVNVSGTLEAVRAASQTRTRRMVFLGSASVYGANAGGATPLDEQLVDPAPVSLYAVTKFAAERLAQRLALQVGVDLRCVRIGSAFGPWEYATGVRDTLSAILQVTMAAACGGAAVLPREGRRDWIYSRDVAGAVASVLKSDAAAPGPINIGLGREWTVADWCALLAQRFPDFRYRLAAQGEEPSVDFHGARDRSPLATKRLRQAVGFCPQYDLAASFDDYMDWMDAHRDMMGEQDR